MFTRFKLHFGETSNAHDPIQRWLTPSYGQHAAKIISDFFELKSATFNELNKAEFSDLKSTIISMTRDNNPFELFATLKQLQEEHNAGALDPTVSTQLQHMHSSINQALRLPQYASLAYGVEDEPSSSFFEQFAALEVNTLNVPSLKMQTTYFPSYLDYNSEQHYQQFLLSMHVAAERGGYPSAVAEAGVEKTMGFGSATSRITDLPDPSYKASKSTLSVGEAPDHTATMPLHASNRAEAAEVLQSAPTTHVVNPQPNATQDYLASERSPHEELERLTQVGHIG